MSTVYLPIEVYLREFSAKSMLADYFAQNGYKVILIPKDKFNEQAEILEPGICIQFGLNKSFLTTYKKLKSLGYKLIVYDEEGLVTLPKEMYLKYRVNAETCLQVDQIWTWGGIQHQWLEYYLKENSINCELIDVGSVVFGKQTRQMYEKHFKEDTKEIKKEYGDFVLVSGSFGSVNHILGDDYYWSGLKDKGWLDTERDVKFHEKRYFIQLKNLRRLREIILRAPNSICFVIRPHPSENIENWLQWWRNSGAKKNIIIERRLASTPWILASKLVLHCGCTNSLEANLSGIGSAIVADAEDSDYLSKVTYDCSVCIKSTHDLVRLLEGMNYIKPLDFNKYVSAKNTLAESLNALKKIKISTKRKKFSKIFYIFKNLLRCLRVNRSAGKIYSESKCLPMSQSDLIMFQKEFVSTAKLKRGYLTIER